MRVIEAGHVYDLGIYQTNEKGNLSLFPGAKKEVSFIHKVSGVDVHPGTTNEEVLAMLIDRMKYLNAKLPCREGALAITKLEESLMWLHKRTELRLAQGVEGQDKAHLS